VETQGTRWAAARSDRGRAFGAVATDYAQWRPSYPSGAVAFLAGGDVVARTILDVGAGTGLLTAPLVAAGHEVLAADTSADMLAELTARLPEVRTLVAGAEALPLPDLAVDVVVAAQAAHWFDPVEAGREFRRVLRPGGAVGFAWNTRVDRSPWLVELAALLAADSRDQQGDREEGNSAIVRAFAHELDAEIEHLEVPWVHEVSPDAVVGRVASSSHVGRLLDRERDAYLGRVRGLLAEHPDTRERDRLDLPYLTSAWRLTPRA